MARTRLSGKGQVVIPKDVRGRHGWRPGAEFEVEDQGDAVILRPARVDPQTTIEQVFGRLRRDAPPLTIEQMNAAVAREARWRR